MTVEELANDSCVGFVGGGGGEISGRLILLSSNSPFFVYFPTQPEFDPIFRVSTTTTIAAAHFPYCSTFSYHHSLLLHYIRCN